MSLSTEIKFILQGGSPTEIMLENGQYTEKYLKFLADNGVPY